MNVIKRLISSLVKLVEGVQGDWKIIPTHDKSLITSISLAEAPEILQSIGPGGKLFNSKFSALRFDETLCFVKAYLITRAYLTARDIQLPLIIWL